MVQQLNGNKLFHNVKVCYPNYPIRIRFLSFFFVFFPVVVDWLVFSLAMWPLYSICVPIIIFPPR
jgi:hypothetical protein